MSNLDERLSQKEQKMFTIFLDALVAMKVTNEKEYVVAIEKFKDKCRRSNNPVNLEDIILEASKFLADSMPSFKSTQWPEFKEKKGFNILYNYGPEEVRNILKSGEGKKFTKELYAIGNLITEAKIKVENGKIAKADIEKAKTVIADYLSTRAKDGFQYKGWTYKCEEDYEPEEATQRYHFAVKGKEQIMLDFTSFDIPSEESFKLLVDNNFPKRPTQVSPWNDKKVKEYLRKS